MPTKIRPDFAVQAKAVRLFADFIEDPDKADSSNFDGWRAKCSRDANGFARLELSREGGTTMELSFTLGATTAGIVTMLRGQAVGYERRAQ